MTETPGVQGVLGFIAGTALGVTQPHEHVSIDLTPVYDDVFRLDDVELVSEDLARARDAGLRTIVDVGTNEHKRSAAFLRAVAQRAGVNVVAATGLWRDGFHPAYLADESVEAVADRLVADIRDGIDDSGVRAGVIGEIGSDAAGFSPIAEKAFRACAAAQRATSVAFLTHTPEGRDAITQLDLLEECGVDPGRVVIGHVDCMDDIEMHTEICRRRAYVGFDRVGALHYQPDDVRLRNALALIERGHADRLILSTDMATRARMRTSGGLGYSYLLESFVPQLRASGVDDTTLEQILVVNPRRLLTGAD